MEERKPGVDLKMATSSKRIRYLKSEEGLESHTSSQSQQCLHVVFSLGSACLEVIQKTGSVMTPNGKPKQPNEVEPN